MRRLKDVDFHAQTYEHGHEKQNHQYKETVRKWLDDSLVSTRTSLSWLGNSPSDLRMRKRKRDIGNFPCRVKMKHTVARELIQSTENGWCDPA